MGTTLNILNEWAEGSPEKQQLLKSRSGVALRWINQAQLRFAEKSEIFRSIWLPTITSTGKIALPSNFLREFQDRVQATAGDTSLRFLQKIDFQTANGLMWATLSHYSIYDGFFYVWAAGAATPSIPYIRKPTELTSFLTADLEIPSEYHSIVIDFLDAKWVGRKDVIAARNMFKDFEAKSKEAGIRFMVRNV